jgi:hypothetical protein
MYNLGGRASVYYCYFSPGLISQFFRYFIKNEIYTEREAETRHNWIGPRTVKTRGEGWEIETFYFFKELLKLKLKR